MQKEPIVSKKDNFSEWYTNIIQKAELADIRYNVKGFIVFQPWSVLCMEKMYKHYEKVLQRKGHKPYFFPTLIPERNFKLEGEHVKGFIPEVFWVTNAGGDKLEEPLALRPTSETVFYQMFSLWIRSYKDLPFKTYQRANVFRYETKATRPFLRSREFHWIEAHCCHADEASAFKQVKEDMQTTKEVMHDIFGLPFIFFKRPQWDKFAGAVNTYAADVLNPDGKVVQQPSTHMLGTNFSKPFNVKFTDKDEKEKFCYITCYGPAISRIFASIIIVHGDDKGLVFPWKIAPLQVIIVPISHDKVLLKKAEEIKAKLEEKDIDVAVDLDEEKSPGEKFYFWEMKGVPVRIELGKKELEAKELTVYRRDKEKKEKIKESELMKYMEKLSVNIDKEIIKKADRLFVNSIVEATTKKELEKAMDNGKIARVGFCSVEKDGEKCAEIIEKEAGATVRGTNLEREEPTAKLARCIICGKKAKEVVYVARQY